MVSWVKRRNKSETTQDRVANETVYGYENRGLLNTPKLLLEFSIRAYRVVGAAPRESR